MNVVNIVDHRMITASMAKVMVSVVGNPTPEEVRASLCKSLQGMATPIQASFRNLQKGNGQTLMVGYVAARPEIRTPTSTELRANYTALTASNTAALIDRSDESTWELKSSPSGNYLVRTGEEDISALLQASVAHTQRTVGRSLNNVVLNLPQPNQIVAFVQDTDMQYGAVLRASTKNQSVEVMTRDGTVRVVPTDLVASAYDVTIEQDVHQKIVAAMSESQAENAREYWRQVFSYSPEYAEKMVSIIDEMAAA